MVRAAFKFTNEFKACGLFNKASSAGLVPFQELSMNVGRPIKLFLEVRSVGHQPASIHRLSKPLHRGQPLLRNKLKDLRVGCGQSRSRG